MELPSGKQALYIIAAIVVLFLSMEYVLPLLLPFLLGSLMAFGVEPEVGFLQRKLHFPRFLASVLGVTVGLVLLFGLVAALTTLLLRQLQRLGNALPELTVTVSSGLELLQSWLLRLSDRLPKEMGETVERAIISLFGSGSRLLERLAGMVLSAANRLLGWLPGGALSLGTGILSAYMISIELPRLKKITFFSKESRLLSFGRNLRDILLSYGKAQLLLMGIIFAMLLAALWFFHIPFSPLWAFLIAIIDAIPVLGTGVVLVPWSIVCMLQGAQSRSIGLLALFAATTIGRTVLEPKFLGKELGLDPLLTLIAMYIGFRLWGILGLILAPLGAVVILRFSPGISGKNP